MVYISFTLPNPKSLSLAQKLKPVPSIALLSILSNLIIYLSTPYIQSFLFLQSRRRMETRRLAVLCSHLSPSTGEAALEASTSATREGDNGGACTQDGCVFCRIVLGEAPAYKLYEDDVCLCILDSSPLTHGHALIIPKCHFPSLEATPPSVVGAMCSKVPFLSTAIMKATQCDSFNFVVNNGKAAGQVVFHMNQFKEHQPSVVTHFHIIPRKAGDRLWLSESLRRTSLEGKPETASLVASIQENLDSSSCDSCKINATLLS